MSISFRTFNDDQKQSKIFLERDQHSSISFQFSNGSLAPSDWANERDEEIKEFKDCEVTSRDHQKYLIRKRRLLSNVAHLSILCNN